ncbi:hypothetical protein M405DRAFT_479821 [Rhizopogon salebrosus TDB-379]|nr:hypothetical protein M405DRAFT_479821 [Rhizopogon salebrosus TDB-379]
MNVTLLGCAVLRRLMTLSHLSRLSRTNLSLALAVVGRFLHHFYRLTERDTPKATSASHVNVLSRSPRNFSACTSSQRTW